MVHDDTIYPQAVGFSLMQFVLISVWKMLKLVVVTMFVGRLRCVKVTTFYPGRAGLGWAGEVWPAPPWPDPCLGRVEPPLTSHQPAKISPVFGSFSMSRSGSHKQRGCSVQIKSSCQVWKIKLLTASMKTMYLLVSTNEEYFTQTTEVIIFEIVEVYRTSCAWLSKPPSPQAPSTHP